jgi:flagellar basal body rod protein FlgB
MELTTAKTENLTELLTQILEFTEQRKEILFRNILQRSAPGFIPQDLPTAEFASCMTQALCEHLHRNRLLFCDSSHIRFEPNGTLKIQPTADPEAHQLLKENPTRYLQSQIQKLSENLFNNRIAAELLWHIRSKTAAAR